MLIDFITIGLIVWLAFLIKGAKQQIKISNYIFVFLGGVVVLFFKPIIKVLVSFQGSEGAIPTGISLVSLFFGIYSIIWAIVKLIKFKKK